MKTLELLLRVQEGTKFQQYEKSSRRGHRRTIRALCFPLLYSYVDPRGSERMGGPRRVQPRPRSQTAIRYSDLISSSRMQQAGEDISSSSRSSYEQRCNL